jgi:hypothetical protein
MAKATEEKDSPANWPMSNILVARKELKKKSSCKSK